MRKLDRLAVRSYGMRGLQLMENAGRGTADVVSRSARGGRVAVVAGKGNNGGDGFVCARHLKNRGMSVTLFSLADPKDIKGDAGVNARVWEKMGGGIHTLRSSREIEKHVLGLRHSSVIVDAIFGTGLSSPPKGVHAAAIELINKLGKKVVSIDVPSGLDASTGKAPGACVRADVTATMALPKLGFYSYPGRELAGRVEVVDIGMPLELLNREEIRWRLLDDGEVGGRLTRGRGGRGDSHKGSFGHVLVLAGSTGKTGAAYMAAMGAMRAGAGLTTVGLPESLLAVMEAKATEVMTEPLPETGMRTLGSRSVERAMELLPGKAAVVIGPGMGASGETLAFTRGVIKGAAGCGVPLVIDADGLNAIALYGRLSMFKKAVQAVLTPHPGEMARLLSVEVADVQADRVGTTERLAKKTGCTVVLKGAGTVVSTPWGEVFINPTGNSGLATAGTGDVLAGMIGGFLAQGMSPVDAASSAVYIHGAAGDRVAEETGAAGMVATDLLPVIPSVIKELGKVE